MSSNIIDKIISANTKELAESVLQSVDNDRYARVKQVMFNTVLKNSMGEEYDIERALATIFNQKKQQ